MSPLLSLRISPCAVVARFFSSSYKYQEKEIYSGSKREKEGQKGAVLVLGVVVLLVGVDSC